MINRLIINSITKGLRKFPKLKPSFNFSTNKNNEKISEEENDKPNDFEEDNAYKNQNRNTKFWWIYRFFVYSSLGIFAHQLYHLYTEKPEYNKIKDAQGYITSEPVSTWLQIPGFYYLSLCIKSIVDALVNGYSEPSVKKMLPDVFHPLFHPKTLALNFTGTMASTQYIVGKGRKLTIRPGVEKLLKTLSEKYEIIIWSDDDYMFLQDSLMRIKNIEKLQGIFGKQCFSWSFKEGTQRNLKYLNRDPRKVIIVDKSSEFMKNYPNNLIVVPQFTGDMSDHQIQKLIGLLQRMSPAQVKDVRQVINKLGQNPLQKYNQILSKAKKENEKKQQTKGFWGKMFGK